MGTHVNHRPLTISIFQEHFAFNDLIRNCFHGSCVLLALVAICIDLLLRVSNSRIIIICGKVKNVLVRFSGKYYYWSKSTAQMFMKRTFFSINFYLLAISDSSYCSLTYCRVVCKTIRSQPVEATMEMLKQTT